MKNEVNLWECEPYFQPSCVVSFRQTTFEYKVFSKSCSIILNILFFVPLNLLVTSGLGNEVKEITSIMSVLKSLFALWERNFFYYAPKLLLTYNSHSPLGMNIAETNSCQYCPARAEVLPQHPAHSSSVVNAKVFSNGDYWSIVVVLLKTNGKVFMNSQTLFTVTPHFFLFIVFPVILYLMLLKNSL